MLSGLRKLLSPPVFDEPEKAAQARSLHITLLGTFALTVLFLIYAIFFPFPGQLIISIVAIGFELGTFFLIHSKHVQFASWTLTLMLWAAIVVEVALFGGIRDSGFGAFAAIILIAGLTLGTRASIIFAAITLFTGAGLAIAENQGLLPAYAKLSIFSVLLSHSITLIAVALLLNLAIRSFSTITRKAVEKEKTEEGANTLLKARQTELEQRSFVLEQQNITLQTIASISRLSNQVKDEKELLEQSAELLIEQTKLEHVGIYVIDQMEEYAILQVSRSTAGEPLVAEGYKLNVSHSQSISLLVGAGMLRFKIGEWNYYIDPPKQLQDMKTSLVSPLLSGKKLIGLLNIQTVTLDPQYMNNQTLQMLADQIALSIANIRLLNQLQSRIQDVGLLEGDTVRNAWDQLEQGGKIGYAYDRIQVLPANETFPPEVTENLLAGKSVSIVSRGTIPRARLVAPIILREAFIGVIGYDSSNVDHEWQEDEKVLLETVAARVSLALENARLLEETTRRADRERTVSEISTHIRSVTDPEIMLQTALHELKRALRAQDIQIRPYSPPIEVQNSKDHPSLKKQKPSKSAETA